MLITATAILVAAGHVLFPVAAIGGVTISLLVIAATPWLGHVFKAFEFPGLGRVEYRELVRRGTEMSKAGLTASVTAKQIEALPVSRDDPLIALAALRIELEKRLRPIAEVKGLRIGNRPSSIGMLARALSEAGFLTESQTRALSDMAGTLNRAVHARSLDRDAADWVLAVGPALLASLDAKVSTVAASISPNAPNSTPP